MKHPIHIFFILSLLVNHSGAVEFLLGSCVQDERKDVVDGRERGIRRITAQNIQDLQQQGQRICSLAISNSNISHLQSGLFVNFTRLMTLSLCNNTIQRISANAFMGLTSLHTLNLSLNPIKEWQTSHLISNIPNLTSVDLTGGKASWLPDEGLLRLKKIDIIHGIRWGQHCWNCSLIKSDNSSQLEEFLQVSTRYIKGYACRTKTTTPTTLVQKFAKHGFLATCVLENSKCYQSEFKQVIKAPCRDSTLSLLYLQYVLGPLAIVLNLIVIIITVGSKRLRKNHDMVFVSNISVGDMFYGIYSFLIVSVHTFNTFDEMRVFAINYCASIGFFGVFGVCLAAGFVLVLTIERYRCVVRRYPSQSKINPVTLAVASTVCWLLALAATVLPMVGIGSYSLNTYCISVFPLKSNPVQYYYSIIIAGILGTMYLLTIPIYIRMYVFVHNSSKNMRIRADFELAKRVFSLVFTNMLFFLLPVAISLTFASLNRETSAISREASETINSSFPLVCLNLNSVFNPMLYAFRSRLFRNELVRILFSRFSCKFCNRSRNACRTNIELLRVRAAYVVHSPSNTSLATL